MSCFKPILKTVVIILLSTINSTGRMPAQLNYLKPKSEQCAQNCYFWIINWLSTLLLFSNYQFNWSDASSQRCAGNCHFWINLASGQTPTVWNQNHNRVHKIVTNLCLGQFSKRWSYINCKKPKSEKCAQNCHNSTFWTQQLVCSDANCLKPKSKQAVQLVVICWINS